MSDVQALAARLVKVWLDRVAKKDAMLLARAEVWLAAERQQLEEEREKADYLRTMQNRQVYNRLVKEDTNDAV